MKHRYIAFSAVAMENGQTSPSNFCSALLGVWREATLSNLFLRYRTAAEHLAYNVITDIHKKPRVIIIILLNSTSTQPQLWSVLHMFP